MNSINRRLPVAKRAACLKWLGPLTLWIISLGVDVAGGAINPVIEGNVRFTVITPECIRIEYAPTGKFIDARSTFAVDRTARTEDFKSEKTGSSLVIDTGRIRLVYKADGQPLGAANLSARICHGAGFGTWSPGVPNTDNLGGTLTTLDMVSGPVDLGEGLLSRNGWFLLDDSRSPLLTGTWVASRPAQAGTDWYLFGYGNDYKAALRSMTTIGGAAPIPRRYAMGVWFSRYWKFTASDFQSIVNEYHQHDFPLDVIVMDMDWHKEGWTGWSWNTELIPDPKELLGWFHKQGLHVTLNLHPADGVASHETKYGDFMKALGKNPADGETLPFDAGSEPYIEAFLGKVLAPLQKDGVDFWWLDWQQYPFTRSIPDLTNLFWMNEILYRSTEADGARGISLSRWGGWGDHRHPVQFSGDADTGWPMLGFEVPLTSTAGNVGCYYWSHDIGGHTGGRNEESYTRWVQFGATTAVLRSHSTNKPDLDRRPWLYPKWAEDSMRIAFHFRSEILPYIYSSAWQTYKSGVSLNRPLYLEYPDLEPAHHNGQEFMLGDNLLVAPITMPGVGPGRVGRQVVWFPPGDTWYNIFTGEKYAGGQTRIISADINEFPVFARGGAPVPMQPYRDRPGGAALDTLRVRCYPGADGNTGEYTLYEDDGRSREYSKGECALTKMSCQRHGDRVTVRVSPAEGRYRGQPGARAYEIELSNTRKATQITVNGKPSETKYDPELGINRISVPALAIREGVIIEAIAPEADARLFTQMAQARRTRAITGDIAQRKSLPDLLVPGVVGTREKDALLALLGIGLMPFHDSPTFSDKENNLAFYAPSGVIGTERVTKISDEGAGAVTEKRSVIELGKAQDPIMIPGDIYNRIEFQIDSCNYFVESPRIRLAGNLALCATASASSTESGHSPSAVIDGEVNGYPAKPTAEWSANRQTTGAHFDLVWDKPQIVRKIVLFDRPNLVDQVTSAKINFSDGSTLDVGALPDDASHSLTLEFPAKTILSLTFEVTGVKPGTENSGLAEIGVY